MYAVLILGHAAAGLIALVAGLSALLRPCRWLSTYLVALVAMLVLLAAAMAARWTSYDASTRLLFAFLGLLGLVVVAQGWRAYRLRPSAGAAPARDHRDSLGFTVIALTDGFVVVALLDLGGPVWLAVAAAVVVAVAGHVALQRSVDDAGRLSPPVPR